MRVMIADERVQGHLQFVGHVFEKRPLVVAGVLHIVAGELDEVRLDKIVDFIRHPMRGLVVGTVLEFEMKIARPNKDNRF